MRIGPPAPNPDAGEGRRRDREQGGDFRSRALDDGGMFVFRCRRKPGRNHVNTPLPEEVSFSRNPCRRDWRLTAGSRPEIGPEFDNLSRSKTTKRNNTAVACTRALAKRIRLKRVRLKRLRLKHLRLKRLRLNLSAGRAGLRCTARIKHAHDGTGAYRLVADRLDGARGPAFAPGVNARVPCGSL